MTIELPTSEDLKKAAHLDTTATDSQLNAFAIDRLSQAFETSAKRWELIVYPTLFAFIILAAYGFYLIFSLAKDMHYLTVSVDTNMTIMANNVKMMSESVVQMSNNVRTMSTNVESMAQNVNTLEPMLASIQNMDRSMQSMTLATTSMRNDLAVMNQNISRPMNFMNSVMPW
jgi:hypothetical protein